MSEFRLPCKLALGVPVHIPAARDAHFGYFPSCEEQPAVRLTASTLSELVTEFTAAVVSRTSHLCLHAAVVATPSGVIAVPGRSGLGKSTLTAALVAAGFQYWSDEVLAFDLAHGSVVPFPRPLLLDSRAARLLGVADSDLDDPGEQLYRLPPAAPSYPDQSRLHTILLAQRSDTGPVSITPAPAADAVPALVERAFNHYRTPEQSFRRLAAAARDATVLRVRYADATELARRLKAYLSATADPLN